MAISRNKLKNKFSQIPNAVITAPVSHLAFRVLAYLYSRPDNWEINQELIGVELKVHRATISRAVKELKDSNLIQINRIYTQGGYDYEYVLNENFPMSHSCDIANLQHRKNATSSFNNTEKENNTKKNKTNIKKEKNKKEKEKMIPEWFGKDIEKQQATKEDILELENLISPFR